MHCFSMGLNILISEKNFTSLGGKPTLWIVHLCNDSFPGSSSLPFPSIQALAPPRFPFESFIKNCRLLLTVPASLTKEVLSLQLLSHSPPPPTPIANTNQQYLLVILKEREEDQVVFSCLYSIRHITISKAHPSQATGLSPPWMTSGKRPELGLKEIKSSILFCAQAGRTIPLGPRGNCTQGLDLKGISSFHSRMLHGVDTGTNSNNQQSRVSRFSQGVSET